MKKTNIEKMPDNTKIAQHMLKIKLFDLQKELEVHINALVEYCFLNVCVKGLYFEELYRKELYCWLDINNQLQSRAEPYDYIWGTKLSEEEQDKKDIEYYQKLIQNAKNYLENISKDEKKKIIRVCLEHQYSWSEMCSDVEKERVKLEKQNSKKQLSNKKKNTR